MKKNILAIIVLIIVAVGCNFFFYNLGKENLKTETQPIKEKVDYIDKYLKDGEKKIADKELIAKIQEKDNRLEYYLLLNQRNIDDIMDMLELYSYLNYMFNTEYAKSITLEEYNSIMNCNCIEAADDEIKMLKNDDIVNLTKEMFGHELDKFHFALIFKGSAYDMPTEPDPESYIILSRPSHQTFESPSIFRDNFKYTEDDNNYYIYFNYSVTAEGKTYFNSFDYDARDTNEAKPEAPKMDSSNYEKFSLVRITYKKADSNFYFTKLEILEDK